MPQTTLQDMLAAKERRSALRSRMQEEYHSVCVTLTMNIPGAEKFPAGTRALFRHAVMRIGEVLPVRAMCSIEEVAGPYAVFAVEKEPYAAKQLAAAIEDGTRYSRLLDLDVYDLSGAPVSMPERKNGRPCFLCSRPSAVCMREQTHNAGEIAAAVRAMFDDFYAFMSRNLSPQAEACAALGIEALLFEAAARPSPGLVDPLHTGAHDDMDFFLFLKSTAALALGLGRCAEAGIRHEAHPAELLPVLRRIGIETEQSMFQATEGVNAQKGALFSMGLILAASGILLKNGVSLTPEKISETLQRMTAGLTARELENVEPVTAGEAAYKMYGITGIRGEMEKGIPSVIRFGLPALQAALARGESCNRALIRTLIALMAEVDDTAVLHRARSIEALRDVQNKAHLLQASGRLDDSDWENAVWEMDAELVRNNLSPGGSADLLAITWYLHRAKTIYSRPLKMEQCTEIP